MWKGYFNIENIPEWVCPICNKGILIGDKKTLIVTEYEHSKAEHSDENWEPLWISGNFSGFIKCNSSKCKEKVVVIVTTSVEEDNYYDETYDAVFQTYYDRLQPKLFVPTLNIFEIQTEIPENIKSQIQEAFYLFFVDSSACSNKIRIVVEFIMDAF